MYVEITNASDKTNPLFAFQNVNSLEIDILIEALVIYKNHLPSTEEFKHVRHTCVEIFHKIEAETAKLKR